MMSSAGFKKGLFLSSDTISEIVSCRDKSTMLIFGDAWTAIALEIDAMSEGLIFHAAVDGTGTDAIKVSDGGFRNQAVASSPYLQKL